EGVTVEYQLNVDEFTIFRDVTVLLSDEERAKLRGARDIDEAFTNAIAPLIADRLEARQNDKPLTFTCSSKKWQLDDHVRSDFIFTAKWPAPLDGPQQFRLVETNFEDQKGQVDFGFASEQGVTLLDRQEPQTALKARTSVDRSPEEEKQLRTISAKF